ncbi:MAG: hypothetical protein ABIG68_00005, partial [Acidobacteriota bacterium]
MQNKKLLYRYVKHPAFHPTKRRVKAGLSSGKAARRINRRYLGDIKSDALRNAPVDVALCADEADAMITGEGEFRILDTKVIT